MEKKDKKSHQPSLVWYRISRAFVYAIFSVFLAMASAGTWQAMSMPRQWNVKSYSYHETTFIDVAMNFILSGVWALLALICFINFLGFAFSSSHVKRLYLKKYKNNT